MISDYDKYKYDYSTYWDNRQYEHKSEVRVLDSLLKNVKGKRVIDIGGSFGRLLPHYYEKFDEVYIIDYSLETLQKNHTELTKKYPNTTLIAANAYHLPFEQDSFDAGLMVRVLHHIDSPQEYFAEIHRVLTSGSTYIQEFANKNHIKAVIKWFFTRNPELSNVKPYQQPQMGNNEGTKGEGTVFLNFHRKYIADLLQKSGFSILSYRGASYLRIPFLKKAFSPSILLFIERILSSIPNSWHFTPSIFIKSEVTGEKKLANEEISLCCPKCHKSLTITTELATCNSCSRKYSKVNNVWDFRI